MYKICIIGQSGSGKGTQAELLSEKIEVPTVSMGQLLRDKAKKGSEMGEIMEQVLRKGIHIPNHIANSIIDEWIKNNGKDGYIIEGYPRNREQFDYMDSHTKFTQVIVLKISDEETRVRLEGRRICPCGGTYHMKYKPPRHNETCDKCGSKLKKRHDSSQEANNMRIRLYHEAMEPIIEEYRKYGIVHEVDGGQSVEKVHSDIMKIFNP